MSILQSRALSRAKGGGLRAAETRAAIVFLTPWAIGFLAFTAFPLIASLLLSFTDYKVLKSPHWIGVGNYTRMLTKDPLFWHSLQVTLMYTLGSLPLGLVVGYLLAVLLNQAVKGLSLFRTVFYLPSVTPAVATSLMWMWVFHPDIGIVNLTLKALGIVGPRWLADPKWALTTFIIMSVWGVGGGMVIYLAGLQAVPTALYESAEIDGAGVVSRFWHITIPMTSAVIFFNLVTGIIGTLQSFVSSFVMTEGGPDNATLFYMLHLYNNAWRYLQMGYGSSMAWFLFILIMALTVLLLKVGGQVVYYEVGR